MATNTLPPDYFRTAAEKFAKNPTNRKLWLQDQVSKANASLIQYQAELQQITVELIKLGAMKGSANDAVLAGSVLAAIPVGFTQIVGGLFLVSASFLGKIENKQKIKRVDELKSIGVSRYNEAVKVAEYRSAYQSELNKIRLVPILLTMVLIWLIIK